MSVWYARAAARVGTSASRNRLAIPDIDILHQVPIDDLLLGAVEFNETNPETFGVAFFAITDPSDLGFHVEIGLAVQKDDPEVHFFANFRGILGADKEASARDVGRALYDLVVETFGENLDFEVGGIAGLTPFEFLVRH